MSRGVARSRSMLLGFAMALAVVLGVTFLGTLNTVGANEKEGDEKRFKVIASGLDNPRGLNFGPDGALYVAEAGSGGDFCFEPDAGEGGPPEEGEDGPSEGGEGGPPENGGEGTEEPEFQLCYGNTGAITKIWDGHQQVLSAAYPSLSEPGGEFAIGLHDVVINDDGQIYGVVGLFADPAERAPFAEMEPRVWVLGSLLQVDKDTGAWEVVKDVAKHEWFENPDGGIVESNPYSVLDQGDYQIVADASGNTLVKVAADGTMSTFSIFPDREVDFPEELGGEGAPETVPMHSVPTSVVKGPDGAYYVGELTGFPFPVGGANVYRVEPGEEPEVYADGFTNIIDIAFDDEGRLLVLEFAKDGILAAETAMGESGGPPPLPQGALIRVNEDGSHDEIASEGLIAPGGLAIGSHGNIYITTCSVCPGEGEVVRIEP